MVARLRTRAVVAAGVAVAAMVTPALVVPAAQAATSHGGSVTLTETSYYTGPSNGPIYAYLNTVFKDFEKSHPGITIKREDIPNSPQYLTTIAAEASAGTLPDVLMLDNPMVPTIASYNVLTPLSSLGKTVIPDLGAAQQTEAKFNGTIYGYPLYTNTIALFYNKAMLSAAHISPPTTWAELLKDAKALTNSQHYGIAFAGENCSGCNVWTFIPFLLTNGGSLTRLTTPQSVQALTLWTDLVKEGAVDKDLVDWNQGQPEAEFAAGKAAMMINGPWFFGTLNAVKGLDYGVVQIPVRTPGQAVVGPIGGEVWTIPKHSLTIEKDAFELLNYMARPSVDAALGTNTGDIPTVQAAVPIWAKTASPLYAPFEAELKHGFLRTGTLGVLYPRVESAVGNAIVAALIGKQTPAAAFATAQKNVNAILEGN
ncbi:MAG: ABC transporter substrate-binding protein [Actinomycetota bacterium]|jgi:multiple sugar transport system substrate-binding protein|nr:ABC transporter substrate-binding protein [Actinomycetota bacterium]